MVDHSGGLVSIIVPIYNVRDLARPCLESLLAQSYADLEFILVNDGSTDGSDRLVEEFAARDARVNAIHRRNGGLSEARNTGIDHAKGRYIVCVDGDDLILPTHVEEMVRAADASGSELVISQFSRVPPLSKPTPRPPTVDSVVEVFSPEEALESLFYQRQITTSAWGKLYKRELFEGIRYPIGAIHEDLPVTYKLIARAGSVAVLRSRSYLYVQRGDSITGQRKIVERISALRFANEAVTFTEKNFPRLVRASRSRLFMEATYVVAQAPNSASVHRKTPEAVQVLNKWRKDVLVNSEAPLLSRGYALASYGGVVGVRALSRAQAVLSECRWKARK